ncbi:hypothetical protein NP284_35855 [Rhodopseudomonas pseudopalustris]|uniref:hypothetical protein n=1 Tax=Rhodopseudomonas pseudopalustris TaxID=1513892 RepID=UPI003F9B0593
MTDVYVRPLPQLGLGVRARFNEGCSALREGSREMLLFLGFHWSSLRASLFQFLDCDELFFGRRNAWTFSTFEDAISPPIEGIELVGALVTAFEALNLGERELIKRRAFIVSLDQAGQMLDRNSTSGRSSAASRFITAPPTKPKGWPENSSWVIPRSAAPLQTAPPQSLAPFSPERFLSTAEQFSERKADLDLLRSEAETYLSRNRTEPVGDTLKRLVSFSGATPIAQACALGAVLERRPELNIDGLTPVADLLCDQFERWQFESRAIFLCLCLKSQVERCPTSVRLRSWVSDTLVAIERSIDKSDSTEHRTLQLGFAFLGIVAKLTLPDSDVSLSALTILEQLRLRKAPNVSVLYKSIKDCAQTSADSEQQAKSMMELVGFPGRLRNQVLADVAVMAILHETGIDVRGASGAVRAATVQVTAEDRSAHVGLSILRRLDRNQALCPIRASSERQ